MHTVYTNTGIILLLVNSDFGRKMWLSKPIILAIPYLTIAPISGCLKYNEKWTVYFIMLSWHNNRLAIRYMHGNQDDWYIKVFIPQIIVYTYNHRTLRNSISICKWCLPFKHYSVYHFLIMNEWLFIRHNYCQTQATQKTCNHAHNKSQC